MRYLSACLLLTGVSLLAQTSTTPTFFSAVSTGMVGLAATQTAQLNVVNLSPAPTTPPVSPCEVQLEFWDSAGKMVKSKLIANLAPGTADSLQIKLTDVTAPTSPLRTEVRGLMRSTPLTPAGSGGSTLPMYPIPYVPNCNTMLTLEVFDAATGVTQALTSDTRAVQTVGIVPLIATTPRQ
jgi:hypothetical protein